MPPLDTFVTSDQALTRAQIGERYLIAKEIVKLAGKPSLIERLMGKEDVKERYIDNKRVITANEEYRQYCEAAYLDFLQECEDRGVGVEKGQEIIDSIYKQEEGKAADVNWSQILMGSLGLSAGALPSISQVSKASEQSKDLFQSVQDIEQFKTNPNGNLVLPSKRQREDTVGIPLPPQTPTKTDERQDNNQPTFGDAINWLNEQSAGISYGIVAFGVGAASLSQSSTSRAATLAATMALSGTGVEATRKKKNRSQKNGNNDGVTLFCGPDVNCESFNNLVERNKVHRIYDDKGQKIEDSNFGDVTLILHAHGLNATMVTPGNVIYRTDQFVAYFFPQAEVIHSLSCHGGANIEQDYLEHGNIFREETIAFIHAGKNYYTIQQGISEVLALLSEKTIKFPILQELNILFKEKDTGNTISARLDLIDINLDEVVKTCKDKDEIVASLYTEISTHLNDQKEKALEKFSQIPEVFYAKIKVQLEKLGYIDYSNETDGAIQEEFVRSYMLTQTMEYFSGPGIENDKVLNRLQMLKELDLFHPNDPDMYGGSIIFHAISSKDYELINFLIANGLDINIQNHNEATHLQNHGGVTPIYQLVLGYKKEDLGILKTLLSQNNIKLDTVIDNVPLITAAARSGDLDLVRTLAEGGIDLNQESTDGYRAIVHALMTGKKEMFNLLMELGADLHKPVTGRSIMGLAIERGDPDQIKDIANFMIAEAVENGNRFKLQELLQGGEDFKMHHNGKPLIHTAIESGNIAIVKSLAENGADVNEVYEGLSPMAAAIKSRNIGMIGALAEKGSDVNEAYQGVTTVSLAVEQRDNDLLKVLATCGANFKLDHKGMPLIHVAVKNGDQKIVETLSKNGVDVNELHQGVNSICIAVESENSDMVKTLTKYGADVNSKGSNGKPIIFSAVESKNTGIIKTLVEFGADITGITSKNPLINKAITTSHNKYKAANEVFQKAFLDKDYEAVGKAMKKKMNLNVFDEKGLNPLLIAVGENDVKMVKILLNSERIDPNVEYPNGLTALQHCLEEGYDEVCDLLSNHKRIKVSDPSSNPNIKDKTQTSLKKTTHLEL